MALPVCLLEAMPLLILSSHICLTLPSVRAHSVTSVPQTTPVAVVPLVHSPYPLVTSSTAEFSI
ncbi:hypothetical protein K469DRAFT_698649 [Zopfia rhizophila CBS 207.26]|uniref:REJ domain-containing protein n=1 Tax=Zopfia rhizophila CBS 207.26 TaxID=1314779 RepID=A0A6A6EUY9_9PEZI|nr:hypothetical protein K469DRAFT_698649 [Zopfia rhizophila CBS 207.26]